MLAGGVEQQVFAGLAQEHLTNRGGALIDLMVCLQVAQPYSSKSLADRERFEKGLVTLALLATDGRYLLGWNSEASHIFLRYYSDPLITTQDLARTSEREEDRISADIKETRQWLLYLDRSLKPALDALDAAKQLNLTGSRRDS